MSIDLTIKYDDWTMTAKYEFIIFIRSLHKKSTLKFCKNKN